MTQKHFFYIILSFVFITSCSKSTDNNDIILEDPYEVSGDWYGVEDPPSYILPNFKQPRIPQVKDTILPKANLEPRVNKGNRTPKQLAKVHIEINHNDGYLKKGQTYTFTVKCDDGSIDLTKGTWTFVCGKDKDTHKLKGNKVEYTVPRVIGYSLDVKFTCQGTTGCCLERTVTN